MYGTVRQGTEEIRWHTAAFGSQMFVGMCTIERRLQQCLNNLQKWSDTNGFKFSSLKTQVVHFCRKRKLHLDPVLNLNGAILPVVDECRFLGLIFDRKLNFRSHISRLKTKCISSINLLKVLSNTDWGSDKAVMLRLYRSLVRSKLDHGSVVYGSTYSSYLKMLDPVHNQGLRLCLLVLLEHLPWKVCMLRLMSPLFIIDV